MTLKKAIELRKSGQALASCELLKELVAKDPHSAELYYQTAWSHDVAGLETQAIPYYALEGLTDEMLQEAYLGLGSTYRVTGQYEKSKQLFLKAKERFPKFAAYDIFLAMTLYNLKEHEEAMRLLLTRISQGSQAESVINYQEAIAHYSTNLATIYF